MPLLFDLLYLCLFALLSPWLVLRAIRTGRYRRDLYAKLFGSSAIANSARKPVVWFHGVSVGEIHLLGTVVAASRKRHPDWHVVVSSTTDTGLAEARTRFADCVVVPFPFDFSWACNATMAAVNPRLIVLAESELWPNFLASSAERRIPVAVINARMSPRSFARLTRIKSLAKRFLFPHIARFAVQSAEYAERLRRLGVAECQLVVTGSVKYDGAGGDRDTPKAQELQNWLNLPPGSIVWVAGSTHAPEEEIVLGVFARLRMRFPHLRLILVPRHPDRFAEAAAIVAQAGLSFARRSSPKSIEDPAVILLDTIGELGAAWGLADIGYTGGSMDGKRGGQSMIEPAGYGVPTVFGPHIWNFRDAARRLIDAGGATMIHTPAELETALAEWIEDPELCRRMGDAARQLVRQQQGATQRTLDVLDAVIVESSRTLHTVGAGEGTRRR